MRGDQVAVVAAVAGGVVPAGGALYERDAEVLHGGCPGNSCGSGLSRELFVRLSATLPPKARGSSRSHENRGFLAAAAYSFCRRSIAASSVASFLAKHSRTRRWPGGGPSSTADSGPAVERPEARRVGERSG